ncbi:hypothetical protein MP228_001386 [Amoeboaphelidium protococcarum]|nr:hypothetical protein MP228_001386 [Amoeboaphelidium protococcarum]
MSNMWSVMLPDKCSTPSWKMSIVLANAEIARLYEG